MTLSKSNIRAAGLSVFLPGTGQLAQGRTVLGAMLVAWSIANLVALWTNGFAGYVRTLIWIELALLTLYAAFDAIRWRGDGGVRRAAPVSRAKH